MIRRSAASTEPLARRLLRLLTRLIVGGLIVVFVLLCGFFAWRWYDRREPVEPTEIYPGIVYRCIHLPDTYESGGLAHICEIDLNHPGIDLYMTPMDPSAQALGWEYRLRRVGTVCAQEHLAVVVNGSLFITPARYFPLPGDVARSSETLVNNHAVNHVDPNSYLMWFSDDLTPHVQLTKPPNAESLSHAKWAIGIQAVTLSDGKVGTWVAGGPDRRTMLAVNPLTRKLWIAAFEHASFRSSSQLLADLGATIGGSVDGGSSTSMALGADAKGVPPGLLIGGLRPVATQVGVRVRNDRAVTTPAQ